MQQLLQITRVPIKMEVTVNRAKLEYKDSTAKVDVTRQRGGFKMEARPIKIQIDSTAMRDTMALKGPDLIARDYASDSVRIGYEAIASIVQKGNDLATGPQRGGYTPAQLATQQGTQKTLDMVLSFLPSEGPDISWKDGTLSVNYTPDKLDFNWDVPLGAELEFVPGKIEFVISQMPRVNIEYIGEPRYVPPSANPNYEPVMDKTV